MVISTEFFLFLVRVFLGVLMIYHGWPKLADLKATSRYFKKLGFKMPSVVGLKVSLLEFAGGVLVILGIFAELIVAAFVFEMLVVVFMKLATKKLFIDYSYNIALIVIGLLIMFLGAGSLTLIPSNTGFLLNWPIVITAACVSRLVVYLNGFSSNSKSKFQSASEG